MAISRQQIGLKTILIVGLLLAFAVYNIFTTSNYTNVKPYEVTSQIARHNSGCSGDSDEEIKKLKRFSKYYQNYRYVGPASRYDYIPVPDKSCGEAPEFRSWWKLGYSDRSREDEDEMIYTYLFKDQGKDFKGTYLELGAYNGQQESNTRFFDICLGWKGLLIEGNPESYQKVLENRPYAHKMSLAPSCSSEYEAANHTIPFYRYPITNVGLVGFAKTYEGKPTVDVPCGPLQPILEDIFEDENHTIPTLDFFSLDVEGAEALVLSTIDFQNVRINSLMIEIRNSHCRDDNCEVRKAVRAKMESEGYIRYEGFIKASDLYVHPQSPFQVSETVAKPTWVPNA